MTKHILSSRHLVPADIDRVWDFFSRAQNLGRVTPRSVGFEIHTPDPTTESGAVIDYTVRPVFGIPTGWRTRIESVDAPHAFLDVQEKGPYKEWHHRHTFEEVEGGVRMLDRVRYAIGWGVFGALAHRLFVRAQLERIFDFRYKVLEERFK